MLSTDEVWRLQGGRDSVAYREGGGDDPECCSFQKMAGEGHYGPGAGTKQGIYVCTSAGRFLASINSNSPKSVAAMLRRALDAWSKLPEAERAPAPAHSKPSHRWEWSYPEDGMVLEETFRYLPGGDAERKGAFNRDYAWFSADEAKLFVSASPASGEQRELPEVLFHRLARQHLLNSVRGESGAFAASEVSGSLHARVLAVDDDKVRLRITGTSTSATDRGSTHRLRDLRSQAAACREVRSGCEGNGHPACDKARREGADAADRLALHSGPARHRRCEALADPPVRL